MGATFPLLASLAPDGVRHPAKAVARVYATAVFGNLAGALGTGFVLLPVFGTERTMLLFVLAGLSFFVFVSTGARRAAGHIFFRLAAPVALGIVVFVIFPGPSAVIRSLHVRLTGGMQYFAEGIEGVVLTHVSVARICSTSSTAARMEAGHTRFFILKPSRRSVPSTIRKTFSSSGWERRLFWKPP